jgi:hypothetical protein
VKKLFASSVLASLALIGAMLPQAASAGTVSYSTSVGPAALDWTMGPTTDTTQYISLPNFDPSLHGGALPSSMTLSFNGYMSPSTAVAIVNFSNASSNNASINGSWTFTLANPNLIPNFTFNNMISASGITVAPGSFMTPSVNVVAPAGTMFTMSGSQTYSPVPFIGAGNFTLAVTDFANIGFSNLNTSSAYVQWFMVAGGNVTVTYEVPTPTPLALLGLGLAALAMFSRRRTAKLNA